MLKNLICFHISFILIGVKECWNFKNISLVICQITISLINIKAKIVSNNQKCMRITLSSTPAGTTMGRKERECGQIGVTIMAGTLG